MWDRIIIYFQTLDEHPIQRMAILVGGLLLFWIIEGAIPLLPLHYKKTRIRHAAVNFGFTIIHLVIHTLLAILIVLLSDWCQRESFSTTIFESGTRAPGSSDISGIILEYGKPRSGNH